MPPLEFTCNAKSCTTNQVKSRTSVLDYKSSQVDVVRFCLLSHFMFQGDPLYFLTGHLKQNVHVCSIKSSFCISVVDVVEFVPVRCRVVLSVE